MKDFIRDYIYFLKKGLDGLDWDRLEEAANRIRDCRGTVWLIGNGGSAALASHMATDLQLAGVRAIALTDVAAMTTYSNDALYNASAGFENSFGYQLLRLGKPEDVLIALSGSGNSDNIIMACQDAYAYGVEMYVVGISGFAGGELKNMCDLHLHAPASHMGQAQDIEQIMLHIICYWLMQEKKG